MPGYFWKRYFLTPDVRNHNQEKASLVKYTKKKKQGKLPVTI